MNWLYGISITCFAASYSVVFILELTRAFFHAPLRKYLSLVMVLAGFFAQSVYLVLQTQIEFANTGLLMGSWSGWFLGAAWLLVLAYLWVIYRQPQSITGLFLWPIVLLLIAISSWQAHETTFSPTEAKTIWNTIHGLSLLLGTVSVVLGFIFGLMYLLQARRLKRKLSPSRWIRYPSLEWLQESCETSLVSSMVLLGLGLLSGIALNLIRQNGDQLLPWNDPVIVSSGVLFGWLLAVLIFNLFYRPARQGRKVAYLVLASFVFLALELGIVWWAGHANMVSEPVTAVLEYQQLAELKDSLSLEVRS